MKWYTMFDKIGELKVRQMKETDIKAIINGKEIILKLKFDSAGLPYLKPEEEGKNDTRY